MAKTNQIQKLVNGEIVDANPVNQIVENAGGEGGLIPYSEVNQERDTTGSESIGNTLYPWGDICINQNAYLREIETTNQSESASIQIKNLRRFITLKDVDDTSYSGKESYVVVVNADEDGLQLVAPFGNSNTVFASSVLDSSPIQITSTTFQVALNFKFKKIASINTITFHSRHWCASGGTTASAILDINSSQTSEVQTTSTSAGWRTSTTLDVSSLTNGTTYDGTIQLRCFNSNTINLSAVTLIGS